MDGKKDYPSNGIKYLDLLVTSDSRTLTVSIAENYCIWFLSALDNSLGSNEAIIYVNNNDSHMTYISTEITYSTFAFDTTTNILTLNFIGGSGGLRYTLTRLR